jgi:hypothetical protein
MIRAFAIAALAGLLFVGAHSAFGQQPPANESDDTGDNSTRAALQKKRADCRQVGQNQGLRGPDLIDQVAVCVQEARLACLKQAIQQKVRGPERTNFITKCLGS